MHRSAWLRNMQEGVSELVEAAVQSKRETSGDANLLILLGYLALIYQCQVSIKFHNFG